MARRIGLELGKAENLRELTKAEIKERLVALGIEYDEKATKDDLIKLLEG